MRGRMFVKHLKPRSRYYDLKTFSTAVLTLNFDLDLSKLVVTFGADAEHLFQISRKSDL